jgi:hypothetical protein
MEVHNCYIENLSKLKVCFQKFIYITKLFIYISSCVIYYLKYEVYCKYLNPNHENSFTMFIKGDLNRFMDLHIFSQNNPKKGTWLETEYVVRNIISTLNLCPWSPRFKKLDTTKVICSFFLTKKGHLTCYWNYSSSHIIVSHSFQQSGWTLLETTRWEHVECKC